MSGTPGTRLPVPGFSDSLGSRIIVRGAGGAVEVLRVAPALSAEASFEAAVREGIGRLASFAHASCGRVRRLDRSTDGSGSLRLHSDYVEGNRLSEILLIAEHQRLPINTSAVLDILRQVVSAVAGLHDHVIGGFHGVLGPERLVLKSDARVVVVEHVLAPALRRMPDRSPVELWRDWRLAVPSDTALPRFGPLTDLVQVGTIAIALLIGRLLRTHEYPGRLGDLLDAASESDLVGSRRPLSRPLREWIEAMLQIDPERRFRTMGEARQCLEALLSDESQYIAAPIALDALLRPRHHRIRVVRQRSVAPAVTSPEAAGGMAEVLNGGDPAGRRSPEAAGGAARPPAGVEEAAPPRQPHPSITAGGPGTASDEVSSPTPLDEQDVRAGADPLPADSPQAADGEPLAIVIDEPSEVVVGAVLETAADVGPEPAGDEPLVVVDGLAAEVIEDPVGVVADEPYATAADESPAIVVDDPPAVVIDEPPEVVISAVLETAADVGPETAGDEPLVVVDGLASEVIEAPVGAVADEPYATVVDEPPAIVVDEPPAVVIGEPSEVVMSAVLETVAEVGPEPAGDEALVVVDGLAAEVIDAPVGVVADEPHATVVDGSASIVVDEPPAVVIDEPSEVVVGEAPGSVVDATPEADQGDVPLDRADERATVVCEESATEVGGSGSSTPIESSASDELELVPAVGADSPPVERSESAVTFGSPASEVDEAAGAGSDAAEEAALAPSAIRAFESGLEAGADGTEHEWPADEGRRPSALDDLLGRPSWRDDVPLASELLIGSQAGPAPEGADDRLAREPAGDRPPAVTVDGEPGGRGLPDAGWQALLDGATESVEHPDATAAVADGDADPETDPAATVGWGRGSAEQTAQVASPAVSSESPREAAHGAVQEHADEGASEAADPAAHVAPREAPREAPGRPWPVDPASSRVSVPGGSPGAWSSSGDRGPLPIAAAATEARDEDDRVARWARQVEADVEASLEESAPRPAAARIRSRTTVASRRVRPAGSRRTVVMAVLAVLVVVLAGGGGAYWWHTSAGESATGTLVVTSEPVGTDVRIDDEPRGRTPLTIDLPPGRHRVEVRGIGESKTAEVEVAVGRSVTQSFTFDLASLNGSLEVTSRAAGIEVYVDGEHKGTAPLTVSDLPLGIHTVTLRGSRGETQHDVTIEAAKTARLDAAETGWVRVQAPLDLQVLEKGIVIGTVNGGPIPLSPGVHRLDFANAEVAFRSSQVVQVAAGQTSRISIDLPMGSVSLTSTPPSEVWIDGVRVGETPIANLSMPLGPHDVAFRHARLGEMRYGFTVTLASPVRMSVDFKK